MAREKLLGAVSWKTVCTDAACVQLLGLFSFSLHFSVIGFGIFKYCSNREIPCGAVCEF